MPFIQVAVSGHPDQTIARTIAQGVTERTARILHREVELTNLAVTFVAPDQWFVGGRSLEELGLASFWLDIAVTDGIDTKDQKAAYLAEIWSFMREVLGPLHEAAYARVNEVSADAWGYGGRTQEERYVRAKVEAPRLRSQR
jgi:4-oxalocrotonate tautomerase